MSYAAKLRRRYDSRFEAWEYLASRGFNCTVNGWENGRWAASVQPTEDEFEVTVWLRLQLAA